MSVLIKGMGMPDNCEDCPCGYETEGVYRDECQVLSREWEKDATSNRPDWCPLVEIPKKARMIDAEALYMDIIHRFDYCDDFLEMLDEAPTFFEED